MTHLKKLVETPITKEDVDKIKWLYSGINAINEKGKKIALEKHLKGKDKYITEEEFEKLLGAKKIVLPDVYKKESERYQKLLAESIYDMTHLGEIKGAKLSRTIGIPDAKENLFEFKKAGKAVFIHVNKDNMKIDMITDKTRLPKKFKEAMK
ncbi:MAG: hypothetical protein PHC66_02185 [Candidatus Nanoarchaeia archaeon]|nr:hypothetical protein [Candidatus Nanoarchaeia archaeon]MDD5239719.1 hypothetical protein [Candidatus Nanoarchaeia archaeon]